jgi:hypothetical protein
MEVLAMEALARYMLVQIHFFLLINKQGKVRLSKWYSTYSQKERSRNVKEVASLVLPRPTQVCTSHVLECTLLSKV